MTSLIEFTFKKYKIYRLCKKSPYKLSYGGIDPITQAKVSIIKYTFPLKFPNLLIGKIQEIYQKLRYQAHRLGIVKIYDMQMIVYNNKIHLYVTQDICETNLSEDMRRRILNKGTYTLQEKLKIIENMVNGLVTLQDLRIQIENLSFDEIYFSSCNYLYIDIIEALILACHEPHHRYEYQEASKVSFNMNNWLIRLILRINSMSIVDSKEKKEISNEQIGIALRKKEKTVNNKGISHEEKESVDMDHLIKEIDSLPTILRELIISLQNETIFHPLTLGFLWTSEGYRYSKHSSSLIKYQSALSLPSIPDNIGKNWLRKQITSKIPKTEYIEIIGRTRLDSRLKIVGQNKKKVSYLNLNQVIYDDLKVLNKPQGLFDLIVLKIMNTQFSKLFLEEMIINRQLIKNIQILNLTSTSISDLELMTLCECRYIIQLTCLILNNCRISDIGIKYLSQANSIVSTLQYLGISAQYHKDKITMKSVEYIANSKYFDNLIHLDISYNEICDEGMHILCKSKKFNSLQILDISGNKLTSTTLINLSQYNQLKVLKYLIIRDITHDLKALDQFMSTVYNNNLIGLEISGMCNLLKKPNVRLNLLTHSTLWKQLKYINLYDWIINKNSIEILNSIITQNNYNSLEAFSAININFTMQMAQLFKNLSIFSNLKVLKLSCCILPRNFFACIKISMNLRYIEWLDLSFTSIDLDKLRLLMQSDMIIMSTKLKKLILKGNHIQDYGVKLILKRMKRHLEVLDVTANELTPNIIDFLYSNNRKFDTLRKFKCSAKDQNQLLYEYWESKLYSSNPLCNEFYIRFR